MRPHDSQVPGHVPALDGLRGIAIAIVFLGHAVALQLTPAGVEGGLREVLRFGWSGVDLFFVLSGFLITGILLDSKGQRRWWPNFFMRRALRIFPLYYGALFLIFIVLPRLVRWHDPDYALLQANQAWYWGYAVNVLNALTNGHGTPLNTAHFWSLAIEEQYYLLWPLVVWLCRPRTLLRVALIASVIGVAFRLWLVANGRPEMAYGLTPGRLDGLLLGGALAVLAREAGGLAQWRPLALRVVTIALIAVAGTAALRGGFEYHDPVVAAAGYPVLALLYGGLLVLALSGSPTDGLSR